VPNFPATFPGNGLILQFLKGDKKMITIKTILVPIDFSESSHKAVLYGFSLAKQYRAKVILLSVIDDRIFEETLMFADSTLLKYNEHDARESRKDIVKKKIDPIVEEMQRKFEGVKIKEEVCFGIVYEEIVKCAQEKEVDMIIMGSHGITGIKHSLIGGITEKVIRKAPCPVLTVKNIEREFVDESIDRHIRSLVRKQKISKLREKKAKRK
jgi:nucleotide-binding universal stress UspA family protein